MRKGKLDVWLVNQYAVPTSMPGITRHFELIKEWQEEREMNVTIWLSHFNYSLRRFLSKNEINDIGIKHSDIRLNWLWSSPHKLNNWKRMLNMISFTFIFFIRALLAKKPDVIIASSPQLFSTYAALIIARLFNKKFILEIRDLWPGSLIAMGGLKPGLLLNILKSIETQLYDKSNQIVVLTEHQRTYLVDRGLNGDKITLVPNGVIINGWEKPNNETLIAHREKMGFSESDFIIIYTGAHGTANALEQLVYAGEYLGKDEFIVLIGDGPEKKKLSELRESKSITQVVFLDPVPKTEILNVTAIANCGIISLEDNEVFRGARPNKLFDYMFLGIPIISTIGGEVEHILKTNEVGLIAKSRNPTDLVDKIRKVKLLNSEELKRIEDRGMNYIRNEGDRKVSAKLFLDVIFKIAKDN